LHKKKFSASSGIAQVVGSNKQYEVIYAGGGVFLATPVKFDSDVLLFDGESHKFERYNPVAESLSGIVQILYVEALKDFSSPTKLPQYGAATHPDRFMIAGSKVRPWRMELDGGWQRTIPVEDCMKEAKTFGILKFNLRPRKRYGSVDFDDQVGFLCNGKKQYPVVAVYHMHHNKGPTPVGSIRVFTQKTLRCGIFVKA
jgi:hypothetical protein